MSICDESCVRSFAVGKIYGYCVVRGKTALIRQRAVIVIVRDLFLSKIRHKEILEGAYVRCFGKYLGYETYQGVKDITPMSYLCLQGHDLHFTMHSSSEGLSLTNTERQRGLKDLQWTEDEV